MSLLPSLVRGPQAPGGDHVPDHRCSVIADERADGLKTAIFHRRLCLLWGSFKTLHTAPRRVLSGNPGGEVTRLRRTAAPRAQAPSPWCLLAPTACRRLPVPAPAGGAGTRADQGPAVLTPVLSAPRCMSSLLVALDHRKGVGGGGRQRNHVSAGMEPAHPPGEGRAGPRAGRWEASETAPPPGRRAQAVKRALGKAGEAFSFSPRNVELTPAGWSRRSQGSARWTPQAPDQVTLPLNFLRPKPERTLSEVMQ